MPLIDLFEASTPIDPGGLPYDQQTPPVASQYNYCVTQFHDAMHGRLDSDNWFGEDIEQRHIQAGAAAWCLSVGGTAALDYPAYLFSAVDETWDGLYGIFEDVTSSGDGPPGQQYAVPGLGAAFYVERISNVLVTWEFEAIIDCYGNGDLADERAAFGLVVDGAHVPGIERIVGPSKELDATDDYTASDFYGYSRSRRWSGHCWIELERGWHNASIYLTAGPGIRLTRVRGRGLHVLGFTSTEP